MCVKESCRPGPILRPMHFMFLIVAFLLCSVVWGFFHANPRGVNAGRLLACNILILALVVAVGGLVRNLLLFPLSRRHAAG